MLKQHALTVDPVRDEHYKILVVQQVDGGQVLTVTGRKGCSLEQSLESHQ